MCRTSGHLSILLFEAYSTVRLTSFSMPEKEPIWLYEIHSC